MSIDINNITKVYEGKVVYHNFSMTIEEGSITTILGPSGAGKTTLLRMIAGVETPDGGGVSTPKCRRSMLFQDPTLLPWYNVEKNISLPLESLYTKDEVDSKVNHILQAVELMNERFSLPRELSGGMKQRVAMARAFAYPSEILLLDEPFQSLDLRLQHHLAELFLLLWKESPRTTVMVTHDVRDALHLSHRIVVFSESPVQKVLDIHLPGEPGTRNVSQSPFTEISQKIYDAILEV